MFVLLFFFFVWITLLLAYENVYFCFLTVIHFVNSVIYLYANQMLSVIANMKKLLAKHLNVTIVVCIFYLIVCYGWSDCLSSRSKYIHIYYMIQMCLTIFFTNCNIYKISKECVIRIFTVDYKFTKNVVSN